MNENMRIEYQTHIWSQGHIFASPDCIVSHSNKMPNENYSGKNSSGVLPIIYNWKTRKQW